jgi:AcrR family transcriptional regulator
MASTMRKSPRLKPGSREPAIVVAAAEFFAEHGFGGTTRALSQRLGVTQALLYRYFPSKQALVERVFRLVFADRWEPGWSVLLSDSALPLEERLIRFYCAYHRRSSTTSMRLWMRASLDGMNFAGRYSRPLTDRILRPVVAGLRDAAGLSDFAARPMLRGERELAMSLHGGIVFLAIRKHIYRMVMPDNVDELIGLQVRAFLPGALAEITRLHGPAAESSLTVQVLQNKNST